jgi:hypothetical protein
MMLRSLAVAALTVGGSGVACAQSVYLYVAPGASVYVTPTPNGYYNGAPTVYEGAYPGPYAPPAPIVAAPLSPANPAEIVPEAYVAPAPTYAPRYGVPLSAYGAAPGIAVQRRVYVEEPVRPPAPVPYGRRRAW